MLNRDTWIAPEGTVLPDFIICGAMKAGTTTLHKILNYHPSVFIPNPEINFFDIDDFFLHPDFSFYHNGRWATPKPEDDPAKFWRWYSSFFSAAQKGQKVGEDSTLYIASKRAISRISLQEKDIKLIVSLRNPTDRAYSNYWHMVRTGRAMYSFQDTIRNDPSSILTRSLYLDQIQSLKETFPEDRIFISIFEDFVADQENTLRAMCDFIGVDFKLLPAQYLNIHSHRASVPKSIRFQLWKNRIDRESANRSYTKHLPCDISNIPHKGSIFIQILDRLHRKINPLIIKKPPNMDLATRLFLDAYFRKELSGLNQLVGKDVLGQWFEG